MKTIHEFLDHFKSVRKTGQNQWQAKCPGHDDKRPSLSIGFDPIDNKVLINCKAGCETSAVLAAVGLEPRDLFFAESKPSAPPGDAVQRFAAARGHTVKEYRRLGAEAKGDEIHIPMRDANGDIVGWRRRRADCTEYKNAAKCLTVKGGNNGLMFNRDAVKAADGLLLCEGETDTAAGMSAECDLGVIGTPGATPGKKCLQELVKLAAGLSVCLCPDPGEAGRKWRDTIGGMLLDAGARVRFIPPNGKDLDERLKDGENLSELIAGAVEWEPQQKEINLDGLFYNSARKEYVTKNAAGRYISRKAGQMKRLLKSRGHSDGKEDSDSLSPIETLLLGMEEQKDVQYVGPLAGRDCGFYAENGVRFLVTDSPSVIEPKPGDWPTIKHLLKGMFDQEQRAFLYGWLSTGYRALRIRQKMPGQALAIAGPRDCFKSFIQNKVFTGVLGGRSARPYQFMSGGSQFNSDLFAAEHLIIEDEAASTDRRARRSMSALIKNFTVNEQQHCHAKGVDALMLRPFWRVSITMNDEPENLMILPPIDESLADKLILLKSGEPSKPMPTESLEQREKFEQTVLAELPAFCAFLDSYEIPADIKSERFGVKHYHHPEIMRELEGSTPERRLLEMINSEITEEYWKGTAHDLQSRLTDSEAGCSYEAKKLLHWYSACGTYLGRLAKKYPKRFEKDPKRREVRKWIIRTPLEDAF